MAGQSNDGHYVHVVDTHDDVPKDENYITYVDDGRVANHDYDDNTDDYHDSKNNI